jgi:hypothetical protein
LLGHISDTCQKLGHWGFPLLSIKKKKVPLRALEQLFSNTTEKFKIVNLFRVSHHRSRALSHQYKKNGNGRIRHRGLKGVKPQGSPPLFFLIS